eukprot:6586327-Prymnesium_polylepis.1
MASFAGGGDGAPRETCPGVEALALEGERLARAVHLERLLLEDLAHRRLREQYILLLLVLVKVGGAHKVADAPLLPMVVDPAAVAERERGDDERGHRTKEAQGDNAVHQVCVEVVVAVGGHARRRRRRCGGEAVHRWRGGRAERQRQQREGHRTQRWQERDGA